MIRAQKEHFKRLKRLSPVLTWINVIMNHSLPMAYFSTSLFILRAFSTIFQDERTEILLKNIKLFTHFYVSELTWGEGKLVLNVRNTGVSGKQLH